jgi:hypothetical protein
MKRPENKNGGEEGNRTPDTGIFSPLLYHLSYLATLRLLLNKKRPRQDNAIETTTKKASQST